MQFAKLVDDIEAVKASVRQQHQQSQQQPKQEPAVSFKNLLRPWHGQSLHKWSKALMHTLMCAGTCMHVHTHVFTCNQMPACSRVAMRCDARMLTAHAGLFVSLQ
jgi:hypothetical protein